MNHRTTGAFLIASLTLGSLAAACGSVNDSADPAGAACPAGDPDCFETGAEGIAEGEPNPATPECAENECGERNEEQSRQFAQGLLGVDEANLPAEVRVSRRGDELYALTEDYRIGRVTAELDDTDGSGFRVVAVTVELPNGPETFTLTPD